MNTKSSPELNLDLKKAPWDSHWQNTEEEAAFTSDAPQNTTLHDFWVGFFESIVNTNPSNSIIDLACGNGVVTSLAFNQLLKTTLSNITLHSVDISFNALKNLSARINVTSAVQADCANLPYLDNSFDTVVSQFGIEYAGVQAYEESARILKPTGTFAGIFHYKGGALFNECHTNHLTANNVLNLGLFDASRAAFQAGFSAMNGESSIAEFQEKDRVFAPVINEFKLLIASSSTALKPILLNVLKDIGYMYEHLQLYNATDVANWLNATEAELSAYVDRMALMLSSAMDEIQVGHLMSSFIAKGFTQLSCNKMSIPNAPPFAWAVEISN